MSQQNRSNDETPLNLDALEAASREVFREVLGFTKTQSARVARRAVSAYLAVAQPDPVTGDREAVAVTALELLEAHQQVHGIRDMRLHCFCGWSDERRASLHRSHVAQVLEQHIQDREAEAWDKGANEVHISGDLFDVDQAIAANPYQTEPSDG